MSDKADENQEGGTSSPPDEATDLPILCEWVGKKPRRAWVERLRAAGWGEFEAMRPFENAHHNIMFRRARLEADRIVFMDNTGHEVEYRRGWLWMRSAELLGWPAEMLASLWDGWSERGFVESVTVGTARIVFLGPGGERIATRDLPPPTASAHEPPRRREPGGATPQIAVRHETPETVPTTPPPGASPLSEGAQEACGAVIVPRATPEPPTPPPDRQEGRSGQLKLW